MEFEIKAKYDQLTELQRELEQTKKRLVEMDAAANPKQYQRYEEAAQDLAVRIGDLQEEIGMTAGAFRDQLANSLTVAERKAEEAGARMTALGEACSGSKKKMTEMNAEVTALSKAYYEASTGGRATADEIASLKKRYDEASKELQRLTNEYYANLDAQNNHRLTLIRAQVEVDKLKAAIRDLSEETSANTVTAADVGDIVEEKLRGAAAGVAKLSAIVAGGVGLKSFTDQCIAARSQLQGMQTALETMVGKNTAQSLFNQLFDIAKRSPLEMTDMVGAEQMMISFGIDAQKSVKYLEALSDISMGNAAKFNSLTLAFSQMSATGKLMGQDLNQMINQGFNPLEAISTKTGKSISQLKDEMSKGLITAEMVQQAFIDVTSEGGRFNNMSAAASKTIAGQMSMLQDALTTMYSTIGEMLEPAVMKAYSTMTELVNRWEELAPYIIAGAVALGGAKLAIAAEGAARAASTAATTANTAAKVGNTAATAANSAAHTMNATTLKAGIKALWAASTAQKTLNAAMAACPYVLAAMAVAAIAGAVYNWATSMTEAEKSQERLSKAMAEADKEADKEASKILEMDAALRKLDTTSSEYAATRKKMVEEARKWNSEAADEIEKNGLTAESYGKVTEAIENHYRVKAYLRWKDQETESRQQMLRDRLSSLRENLRENYVGDADDPAEKRKREIEVNKAMAEISKKLYAGTLEGFDGRAEFSKAVSGAGVVGAVASVATGKKNFKNSSLSEETNAILNAANTLSNAVLGYGDAATDVVSDMARDARETLEVLQNDDNLVIYGLDKDSLDAERKRQEDENRKKEEENKKKAEKEKNAAKGKDKDAEKKAKEAAQRTEKLRQGVAAIEAKWDKEDFDRQEDSLAKRREAIIRSYEERRKTVNDMEKSIATSLKAGDIKSEEADSMRATLGKERDKIATNQAADIIKLYSEEIKANATEAERQTEEFEKRRLAIAEEYARKRAALDAVVSSEDATEEQKAEATTVKDSLGAKENADIAKVDLEEFQHSELYTKVFQDMSKFGLTTMQSLKDKMAEVGDSIRANLSPADAKAFEDAMLQIETRLTELDPFSAWQAGYADMGEALKMKAEATEKLVRAQKELRSVESALNKEQKKEKKDATTIAKLTERKATAEKNVLSATLDVAKAEDKESEASTKQQKAKEKISEAFKDLEKNAQAVCEVLGDGAGQVFTFIDSTVSMVKTAITGMQTASTAATAAMKAVETASVILAIIAAAMQVIKAIANLFGGDDTDKKYKEAVAKQQEINKMRETVEMYTSAVLEAKHAEENWFSSSTLSSLKQSWETAADAQSKYMSKLNEEQVMYRDHTAGRTLGGGGDGRDTIRAYYEAKEMGYDPTWNPIGFGNAQEKANNFKVKAVDNLRIVTREREHGTWFRKGKSEQTQDLRTWTKENLGVDLFDGDKLNIEAAETIIEQQGDKLAGETKATLEALVEQQKAYEEAMDQIKQGVADMFSPLVDNLTDAVWNWLETGEDALTTFKNSASSTFKSIAQDMIKTMANKLIFSKYSEQVEELGEKYAKGEISEEELMSQALDLTDSTMQNAEASIKTIEAMSKRMDEKAKELGYDMKGSSEVTASGGGFETMSETTATELSGRFTALYEVGLRQEALLTSVADGLTSRGFLSNMGITLANISSSGLNALLVQAEASVGMASGISDCLAQSYLALQDLNETATRQEKSLKSIHLELVKVRKVTDTL